MRFFKAASATPGREAGSSGWRERLRTTKFRTLGVVVVAGAMVVTSTSSAGAAGPQYGPTGAVPATGTKIAGGTAYFQEGPSAPPTYIFPFISPQVCSTMNYGQLTYIMYRPLYWFGNNNSPTVDPSYSIANPPTFTNGDKTVTVTLKHWMWSDGEQVTSRDVEFWMNMFFAEKDNWCDYTPGYFPDNIASMAYPNSSTVVFHMKEAYNPTWFLYNELSQITPLPIAWDVTAKGQAAPSPTAANLPDTTPAGVAKVYTFLNSEATDVASYATSPYWSIVDGPWKVKSFTSTGQVTFVPNTSYSGSPKPTLSQFVEVPFTSDEAALNELKSGGPNALSMAELPDEYIPQLKSVESEGYNAVNFTGFSFSFFPLNFGNPIMGPVFSQLYFRQAFQHVLDQKGWIDKILDGYAVPTYGPVPLAPPNSFADSYETDNPYQFSTSDAASILKAHGWADVGSGQVAYCAKPGTGAGECGAGIPMNRKLQFGLLYQSGAVITAEEVEDLKSQASQVGIDLELTSAPFAQVVGHVINCGPGGQAKPSSPKCSWTALDWGAGWIYAPDFEPTGETLFYTGAGSDYSGYSSAEADHLIALTTTAPASQSQAAIDNYENYMAQQLPVVFQPTATGSPTSASIDLISKHLGGYINNVYFNLTPETWYLTK
jgi:peptide/nickel transport system substrate-binding protein